MLIVDRALHGAALNSGMLPGIIHSFGSKDGSLINFSLFHVVDDLTQRLQASTAVAATGKLFAVYLFDLRQFIPVLQPRGFICLTGLKSFL